MNNTKQDNSYYDSWRFIENYLPNYYHRDDVLRDDILLRYVDGDDVCEGDLSWIEEEFKDDKYLVKEELIRIESRLMEESLQAYYGKLFPQHAKRHVEDK